MSKNKNIAKVMNKLNLMLVIATVMLVVGVCIINISEKTDIKANDVLHLAIEENSEVIDSHITYDVSEFSFGILREKLMGLEGLQKISNSNYKIKIVQEELYNKENKENQDENLIIIPLNDLTIENIENILNNL